MNEKELHTRGSILRDVVFAASDGMITTFAVVAGSTGASLGDVVVIILGFANLFADGISMAAGIYLGVKSEADYSKAEGDKHIAEGSPITQGLITWGAFVLAGLLPLLPFIFKLPKSFELSGLIVFVMMFVIGAARGRYTKRNWARSGMEMLVVGGMAALVAYLAGFVIEEYVFS